ncbi:hypothetical protein CBS101457_003752 [Exobasidium rhododendri]|nr:hypothetical protein CBS101457_003752 [Exobasidium rhododendri]
MSSSPSSSSTGGSHPNRPYYKPSDSNAAYIATAPRFSSNTSAATNAGTQRSVSNAAPLPPTSNRYASASLDSDVVNLGDSTYASQMSDATKALFLSAAFQYASTCLAMPFEVGKLLLQVQWVPKDEVWIAFGEMEREDEMKQRESSRRPVQAQRSSIGRNEWNEGEQEGDENEHDSVLSEREDWLDDDGEEIERPDFGGERDELSDEEEAEAYFKDLTNSSSRPSNVERSSARRKRRQTDSYGYVMRKSIHEDGARPEFVMPVVVRGGVWEMIKAVGRGKEGWLGLWKGTFTTFTLDVCTSTIQPIVSSILSLVAPSALTSLPLPYAPHPYRSLTLLLTSHLVTGVILSPIDLVRTRLIAQSTLPPHRKYSSPKDALSQMLEEEGGWKTVYLHPNLLIPTILDFSFRPLFSLGAPLLIEHKLRLDPLTNPVSYSLAEFCISSASLLITLPIETVRRRLQLQARAAWGKQTITVHGSRSKSSNPFSTTSSSPSKAGSNQADTKASVSGTVPKQVLGRPLRTCVETRPKPYEGVMEAIYRILIEESSISPDNKLLKLKVKLPDASASTTTSNPSANNASMQDSGILAKQGHSSLGGLFSLYRGFGFAIGANALVFVLTTVTGERANRTSGWAEI